MPSLGQQERRRGLVSALGWGGEEKMACARPRAGRRGNEGVCPTRAGRDKAWVSFPLFIASCTFETNLFVLRELFRNFF